jgi:GntR family transcriptional regulator
MAGDVATEERPAVEGPDFRPLYSQVRELMIRRMVSGDWRPGDALPSEARLAAEFGVSQGTVRKALDELAARNLVVRQQGRGTFIARHSRQRSIFHFFHIFTDAGEKVPPVGKVLALCAARASREQAQRLALPARARVWEILRLRAICGAPVILERIAVPVSLFPDLELPLGEEQEDELYVLYQRRFGVTIARAEERLKAVAADEEDALHLGVAAGAPLLEIDRVARDLEGRAVEWRCSRCDTASHSYVSEIE